MKKSDMPKQVEIPDKTLGKKEVAKARMEVKAAVTKLIMEGKYHKFKFN